MLPQCPIRGTLRQLGGRARTSNLMNQNMRAASCATPEWANRNLADAGLHREWSQLNDLFSARAGVSRATKWSEVRWLNPMIRPNPTPTVSFA